MPRRLPLLPLALAAVVGLFALTSYLTAQPPGPATPPPTPAAAPTTGEGIKRSQEENFKLYQRFADELLKLAQKWEKSDSIEERERAKSLRAALKLADQLGIEALFKEVVRGLGSTTTPTDRRFQDLLARDATLIKALEEVLLALNTEDENEKLKRDIAELKELIKLVEKLKRTEENIVARTNSPKSDPNKIAKDQNQNAKDTKDVAARLNKSDPKDPKNASATAPKPEDQASEPKGEGKPGDNAAEAKPDTKEPKSSEKDPPASDPKAAGDKPQPKGGMPPADAGMSKDPPKDGAGEPMSGKGMGEPKPSDPKTGDTKPKDPAESKSAGAGKGDSKPSQGQGGEAKPMSPGGKPSDSPPSGSGGKPSGSPSSPPPGPSPPNPNNPNDEARRNVEEAVPPQQGAEDDLKKDQRKEATKKQDEAIQALDRALKELEKRLKQLREKEMLKKLEDLERRVAKMLKMQIEVYEATKGIDATVRKNNNQKSTADIQKAGVEGDKEGEISLEAEKALRLLEGEGTAVVFAGVLIEVRKDMDAVQKQLTASNVGAETQLVEEQIIAQLQQMLEALKKAKQELQKQPPPPGEPPPPGDGKKNLIQLVEQLKLLKSLQVQVNDRTTAFSKRTPGEQATDTFLQEQLKQLGDRQKVLQEMLHKVAEQLNQQ